MKAIYNTIIYVALITITTTNCFSQEVDRSVYYSKKFLDLNIKSLTKHNQQFKKQQDKLLKRLKRKEAKYAKQLQKKDSVGFTKYKSNQLTFDSISRLAQPDSIQLYRYAIQKPHKVIDSLKGVQSFLENKVHLQGKSPNNGYDNQLSGLKGDLAYSNYVQDLINRRTSTLKYYAQQSKSKVAGLKGMQKQVFYTKSRIKNYKQIAEEPSKLEEEALYYLQGEKGFSDYLEPKTKGMQGVNGKQTSLSDLEKMGYQTKRKMAANLQKKFGSNLGNLQQRMGGQIKDYQDQLRKTEELKKNALAAKQSVKRLKHISKPDFKINPMRGQPFWQRIEKQYNWYTTRAGLDGQPATFNAMVMAGFKHTPRLSYGTGITTTIGLGQNWSNIKFTFEGIGFTTYAAWQWEYGIGAYAGYERVYQEAVFQKGNNRETPPLALETNHNKKEYKEAVLIGLTKRYQISDKWSGSVQLLYDIWWQEKGLRSPIQLRFATLNNR